MYTPTRPLTRFLPNSIAAIVVALTAVYFALRPFVGIDLFDESYWMSVPWRFAIGDRPYVDDKSFLQNFGLFLVPLVRVHQFFFEGPEGLVLFMRLTFSGFLIALGSLAYTTLRAHFSIRESLLLSVICVLVPSSVSNFSYTTMGITNILAGTLLLWRGIDSKRAGWFVAAGVCHAIAMASHPMQIPTCLALGFGLVLLHTPKTLLLSYVGTILAIGMAMILYATPTRVMEMWEYKAHLDHSELSVAFFKHVKHLLAVPYRPLIALYFLGLFASLWKPRSLLPGFTLALLPVVAWLITESMGYGSAFYFTYFGLFSLALFPWVTKDIETRRLFWLLFIPSIVAGIAYTWGGNYGGITRFSRGMVPAALCTAVLILRLSDELLQKRHTLWVFRFSSLTLASFILLFLHARDTDRTFPIRKLTAKVSSGPFRGLYTTPERKNWIATIEADVIRLSQGHDRIFFHPHFPAGYLMTRLRPAFSNTWWTLPMSPSSPDFYLSDYQRHLQPQTVAVLVKELHYGKTINVVYPTTDDKLGPFIENSHHLALQGKTYDIYVSSPDSSPNSRNL